MAIAELFIGAFITVLFEKLASPEFMMLAKSAQIDSKLENLKNTLTLIKAVLADAAEKQIRDASVQLWLNKLQHLAYEIDDVLDDLATEVMRSELNQATTRTSKVLKTIPTKFHALKYGLKMSSKLDKITSKLRDLVVDIKLLRLSDKVERSHRPNRQLEETSLVGESIIVGREADKEALLGKLLDNESSNSHNINVVSIVGLGGIGKSTLAQLLYNDKEVKSHFELMSWVCISNEFDVLSTSKAIYKDVGGGDKIFETLNQLQVALTKKLSEKRFLLVLDDVWDENNKKWELFKKPFTTGAHGSKILVTTRSAKVASVMDSVETYVLDLLSCEEALSLFAQHASCQQNFDVKQTLKLHGEDIVKKCGRLPLALKSLGRVFKTKVNVQEWEELFNSEIWQLDDESGILPALKLSYHDLTPHLKRMFMYCSLFPKDYTFDMDELVLLWMAEGFLCESHGKKSMESFGRDCFKELMSRSFFQHSNNDKSHYIMHDLINDLARSVAGDFFFMLEDKMDVCDRNIKDLEKFHHISFIQERYAFYTKFKELQKARHLRSFIAISCRWQRVYLSNEVLVKLLPQLQFLRVLSLANYSIIEVPESIGILKHLRYLNFSDTNIKCLPEQVGDLHNLQSLLLSGCHKLRTLPNSIIKLINLRHLDITDTPNLNEMPLGFRMLTSLQTLSKVIIGGSGEFIISYLEGFLHLRGQLSIEGLQNVKCSRHAEEAKLQQKKDICDLRMEWSDDVYEGSRNTCTEYKVLERLRPFEELKSLEIIEYGGTKFPSWVGDSLFVCLIQLTLSGCRSCKCLPTLGNLPSLQKLCVYSMEELDRVGPELLGHSNSCTRDAFPSLEVLEFEYMQNWKEWSTSGGENRGMFPCLREISIKNCPKLDVVAIDSIPSLRVLHVSGCSVPVLKSMVGVSSSIASLNMSYIKGLTQLHREVLEHLRAVKYLNILGCDDLKYLWESEIAAFEIFKSLQKLEINYCNELVSLGEKELHLGISMESVTEVRIEHCPELKSYNCPNRLEKLVIQHCPLVTLTDAFPSTLKFLDIKCCDNLEVRWSPNSLSSLTSLDIFEMSKLRSLPKGFLFYLTRLSIWYCDNIESIPDNGYGFLPFLCLKELVIADCKNLKSFPHEHMESLASLVEMRIFRCPSLDDSFPCGMWPPNFSFLEIGELKKPMTEWGQQNFPTSLVTLRLHGKNSGVVSFAAKAEEDISDSSSFFLPSSLTELQLSHFMELKSLSKGLQHLTCLQHLHITSCSELRDLPKALLPSLVILQLYYCSPELIKKCRPGRKGKYWPIISQIPYLTVYDPDVEDSEDDDDDDDEDEF